MQLQTLGFILHTAGEVFIAYTVLRVHRRMLVEKKIDRDVFKEIRFEQLIGFLGITLIIVGFILELAL